MNSIAWLIVYVLHRTVLIYNILQRTFILIFSMQLLKGLPINQPYYDECIDEMNLVVCAGLHYCRGLSPTFCCALFRLEACSCWRWLECSWLPRRSSTTPSSLQYLSSFHSKTAFLVPPTDGRFGCVLLPVNIIIYVAHTRYNRLRVCLGEPCNVSYQ